MKILKCPNCGANLSGEITNGRTTCEYCRRIILIESGNNEIKDINTGLIIGESECPKGYMLGGILDQNMQSSIYPLTTLIWCENADKTISFFKESGKAYIHYLKHPLLKHIDNTMDTNYSIPMLSFNTIETYLDNVAKVNSKNGNYEHIKDIDIMPIKNIDDSIPDIIRAEMEHQSQQFSYTIDKNYTKHLTRLYKVSDGYLLLSSILFAIKWSPNVPDMTFGINPTSLFNLFSKKNEQSEEIQLNEEIKEMITPTKMKGATIINWWVPFVLGLRSKEMPDETTLRDFAIFSENTRESSNILERRFTISNQYISNIYATLQNERSYVNNYVQNAQMDIRRRQSEINASIQSRNNIINSVYQNRTASQDRMRQNFSEATRGVDTYVTNHGTTEFKTGAKRVIERNNDPKQKIEIGYLDSIPDGWTEIFKQ